MSAISASDSTTYQYEPLSPREFRFLLLFPAVDEREVLRCELMKSSLNCAPKYDAISYHWGSSSLKSSLICSGKRVAITSQLVEAL
jgi:hypothetical protein